MYLTKVKMIFLFIMAAFTDQAFGLGSPSSLSATEVSTHSLTVAWRATEPVDVYEATISPLDEGETSEETQFIYDLYATWVDLVPGKNYTVNVIAYSNDGRTSSVPSSGEFTTQPMPAHQVRVSKFVNPVLSEYQVGAGDRTMMFPVYGAVLVWENPDVGYFNGYNISVSPPDGAIRLPIYLQASTPIPQALKTRRIIWDLVPGVWYDFGVQTRSGGATSEISSVGERMPPEIPSPVKIERVSPTDIALSWEEPHRGILDGFVVEVDPPTGDVIEPADPTEKGRTITGLTPGSIYNLDIYSTSFGVLSFKPRTKEIKTPPARPLGPVETLGSTVQSVTISWNRPAGALDYYEVVYFPTLNDVNRLRHRVYDTAVELTSLQTNTSYSLIIFAVSNLLYSKPLYDSARTGSPFTTAAITTTTPPTTTQRDTTPSLFVVETVSSGTNDEKTTPEITTTISPGKLIQATTVNTVGPGETLAPHHSVPYEFSSLPTFPTTEYFPGRVTTWPNDETTSVEATTEKRVVVSTTQPEVIDVTTEEAPVDRGGKVPAKTTSTETTTTTSTLPETTTTTSTVPETTTTTSTVPETTTTTSTVPETTTTTSTVPETTTTTSTVPETTTTTSTVPETTTTTSTVPETTTTTSTVPETTTTTSTVPETTTTTSTVPETTTTTSTVPETTTTTSTVPETTTTTSTVPETTTTTSTVPETTATTSTFPETTTTTSTVPETTTTTSTVPETTTTTSTVPETTTTTSTVPETTTTTSTVPETTTTTSTVPETTTTTSTVPETTTTTSTVPETTTTTSTVPETTTTTSTVPETTTTASTVPETTTTTSTVPETTTTISTVPETTTTTSTVPETTTTTSTVPETTTTTSTVPETTTTTITVPETTTTTSTVPETTTITSTVPETTTTTSTVPETTTTTSTVPETTTTTSTVPETTTTTSTVPETTTTTSTMPETTTTASTVPETTTTISTVPETTTTTSTVPETTTTTSTVPETTTTTSTVSETTTTTSTVPETTTTTSTVPETTTTTSTVPETTTTPSTVPETTTTTSTVPETTTTTSTLPETTTTTSTVPETTTTTSTVPETTTTTSTVPETTTTTSTVPETTSTVPETTSTVPETTSTVPETTTSTTDNTPIEFEIITDEPVTSQTTEQSTETTITATNAALVEATTKGYATETTGILHRDETNYPDVTAIVNEYDVTTGAVTAAVTAIDEGTIKNSLATTRAAITTSENWSGPRIITAQPDEITGIPVTTSTAVNADTTVSYAAGENTTYKEAIGGEATRKTPQETTAKVIQNTTYRGEQYTAVNTATEYEETAASVAPSSATTNLLQVTTADSTTKPYELTPDGATGNPVKPSERVIPIREGFSTLCKPNNITILVDEDVIGEYESKYGPLHLNDHENPACRGIKGNGVYRYTIAPNILDCGTQMEINETHVNFTNTVSNSQFREAWLQSLEDDSGSVILGSRVPRLPMVFIHMKIWCTFPIDLNVTAEYPFIPEIPIQILTFNISGRGEFSAVMQLYRTGAYAVPYLTPPALTSDETLYVGINLLESQDESIFMAVRKCWATPDRSPDYNESYPIIEEYCAMPDKLGGTVKINENGVSKQIRWEGSVFKFVNYDYVWLHCEIRICFGDMCQPNCSASAVNSRSKRSNERTHVISTGPVVLNKHPQGQSKTTETPTTGAQSVGIEETTVLIIVASLSAVIILCCVVIICVMAKLKRRRQQRHKSLESAASASSAMSDFGKHGRSTLDDYYEMSRPPADMGTFCKSRLKGGVYSVSHSTSNLVTEGDYDSCGSSYGGTLPRSGSHAKHENLAYSASVHDVRTADIAFDQPGESALDFPPPPSDLLGVNP